MGLHFAGLLGRATAEGSACVGSLRPGLNGRWDGRPGRGCGQGCGQGCRQWCGQKQILMVSSFPRATAKVAANSPANGLRLRATIVALLPRECLCGHRVSLWLKRASLWPQRDSVATERFLCGHRSPVLIRFWFWFWTPKIWFCHVLNV